MKTLWLLILCGVPLFVPVGLALAEDPATIAETPSAKAVQSPAGVYSAGQWRTGLSLGMASVSGLTYTTAGGGAGFYAIDGLEVGAGVRGWFSSAPSFLEITPEVRYVAWQLPGFKPYGGAFYRWNSSRDGAFANSYGGRLGMLYNKRNSRMYLGAGAVWEQLADCRAAGLANCTAVYPELFLSAGPITVAATRAPLGLRP